MIVNQTTSRSAVTPAIERAERAQQVVERTLAATLNVRQTEFGGYSSRLARSQPEVDNMRQLTRMTSVMAAYVTSALETAATQKALPGDNTRLKQEVSGFLNSVRAA